MDIVVASNNQGKIKEIKEILTNYNILSLNDLLINIDVEEDKDTFLENSQKKSMEVAKYINNGTWCIADDSGIEIEYLGGFPGVYSKRWHSGTDKERNLAILEKLSGVEREKRKVEFICAMSISNGEETYSYVGKLEGYIANKLRGKNGFGFDEIFELNNGKTLAELSSSQKNQYSARKMALEGLKKIIDNNIKS